MSNWYDKLKEAMKADGESFIDRVCTLTDEEMSKPFDDSFGFPEGAAFTAWGERWVYFPLSYDGAESIGHAPRNPCDLSMKHQGGW